MNEKKKRWEEKKGNKKTGKRRENVVKGMLCCQTILSSCQSYGCWNIQLLWIFRIPNNFNKMCNTVKNWHCEGGGRLQWEIRLLYRFYWQALVVYVPGLWRTGGKGNIYQKYLLDVFWNFAKIAVQRLKCNKSSSTEEAI